MDQGYGKSKAQKAKEKVDLMSTLFYFYFYYFFMKSLFRLIKSRALSFVKNGKIGWEDFSPELNKEKTMLGSWIYGASLSWFFCFS